MTNRSFFEDVYEVVKLVPAGRVTTYGAIARYLSLPNARMVGWAMNALHGRTDVPAHRVVNSKGELSGADAFGSPSAMANALEREGVSVRDRKILHFAKRFWNPETALAL